MSDKIMNAVPGVVAALFVAWVAVFSWKTFRDQGPREKLINGVVRAWADQIEPDAKVTCQHYGWPSASDCLVRTEQRVYVVECRSVCLLRRLEQ